jgi:hypothetical protein
MTWTHSLRYTPTLDPNATEDRVIAGNRFRDEAHCVITSNGEIGFYLNGLFQRLGTMNLTQDITYSIIIKHDDLGNGSIYVNGTRLGVVTSFPKSKITQIGNFRTKLVPEVGLKPRVRLKPRGDNSVFSRPCLGRIDEYICYNRGLTESEIIELSQTGVLSKVYSLADYYLDAAADDNKITPIEKPQYRESWISLWNQDQRLDPLPVDIEEITVDGEFMALAIAASDIKIWTPETVGTEAYDYYQAVEAWRAMLYEETVSGFLLEQYATLIFDISTLMPDFDFRLANLNKATSNFVTAIMTKKQQDVGTEIVANSTPKYLGTVQDIPDGTTVIVIKGPEIGTVTAKLNDWVLMTVSTTAWTVGECYRWNGTAWVRIDPTKYVQEYQAAIYDILSIPELTTNTSHFGALFAKVFMTQQAAIDELSTKLIKLSETGKIFSGVGAFNNANTPVYLDGTGKLSLGDVFSWNGSALVLKGSITADDVGFSRIKTRDGFSHWSSFDNAYHNVGYVLGYAWITIGSDLSVTVDAPHSLNVYNALFRQSSNTLYISWSFPSSTQNRYVMCLSNARTTINGSWQVIATFPAGGVGDCSVSFDRTIAGVTSVSVVVFDI